MYHVFIIASRDGAETLRGYLTYGEPVSDRARAVAFESMTEASNEVHNEAVVLEAEGAQVDWAFIIPDDGLHPYDRDDATRFIVRVEGPNGDGWVSERFEDGSIGTDRQRDGAMPFTAEELADVMIDMSGVCQVLETQQL